MSKHTPALTVWQDVTAPVRPFPHLLRTAITIALLVALLAVSIALQHAAGIHSGGLVSAAVHPALADGPNVWGCGGAPGPC